AHTWNSAEGPLEHAPHECAIKQWKRKRKREIVHAAQPGRRAASQTLSASTVSATSCTRTMRAPFCTAASAAATLATSRCEASRPVSTPSEDLRDHPASTG